MMNLVLFQNVRRGHFVVLFIVYQNVVLLKKSFWWTHVSCFGATGTLFWISVNVSSGFQSQSGFCFSSLFCRGKCNVHSPRSTSGATPADLLMVSVTAGHFPKCISRGGSWLEQAITRTKDERATAVPAIRLKCCFTSILYILIFIYCINKNISIKFH